MTNSTKCLTPGTYFGFCMTTIIDRQDKEVSLVSMEAMLPFRLDLTEEQAEELETLLHNQFELVLSRYFNK